MTTVGFMSKARPATYAVDDEVSVTLFDRAAASQKANGEAASKYVNRLLKWALDNYKEEIKQEGT